MGTLIFLAACGLLVIVTVWACQRIRDPGRQGAVILLCAILAFPALPVVGGVAAVVANDLRLARFAAQLQLFPLPPGARLISTSSQVGVLTGNGDHCDFVATVRIGGALTDSAVRAHYAGLHLEPAITGGADGGIPEVEVSHGPRDGGRSWIITAVDAPYEGIFDPRCF